MENLNKYTDSENFGEIEIVNSKKKGSFLEWIIKRIFQTVGFYATNKNKINNNQIDVFVNYNDIKIVVECKQYEKNTPAVKNLVYEWNSKRTEMECDKSLLVLWGYPKIEQDELKLAKKLNVYLWNDTIISYFFDLILSDTNKAKNEILLNLEIDNLEIKNVLDSIKEHIEKTFKDFSLEKKDLLASLKYEIVDCYKDGILIKIKKFEIIWEFLMSKGYYLLPKYRLIQTDEKTETNYIQMQDHPCSIQEMFEIELIDREKQKSSVMSYEINAISKDGTTLIKLNPKLKMTDG